jgi:hypothetical protein
MRIHVNEEEEKNHHEAIVVKLKSNSNQSLKESVKNEAVDGEKKYDRKYNKKKSLRAKWQIKRPLSSCSIWKNRYVLCFELCVRTNGTKLTSQ